MLVLFEYSKHLWKAVTTNHYVLFFSSTTVNFASSDSLYLDGSRFIVTKEYILKGEDDIIEQ